MRITVTGRRTDVSEALKAYANQKASKLERFYDRVQSVEIVFDVDAGKQRCEIIAKADHAMTFVAREDHVEPYASLDAAVKDLERQLTRHKERFRNRKHLAGRNDREPLGGPSSGDIPDEMETEGEGP
ncbi:MAG: ribosome-associated translation inhibitor RaiA [Phycisphaerae bacterium]|nr:ribosome-associated translation inhibitor RaiA [Phycisphaerae bacterium]